MTEAKKSKKFLWIFIVVLLIGGGVGAYFYERNKGASGKGISYRIAKVKKGEIKVSILSTGVTSPENRVEIKPPIAGRVEKVLIEEGAKVRKGQVLAWMSSTERAALLDAATARGKEELKSWEQMYRPTPILAPIKGTIIQRNVESGQTFTVADAVFVMSDRLTVKAQVDETDISQIKLKQKAHLILDAYPNEVIEGYVDQIAFDAKTVNNVTTYIVDVLPEETPDFMRSGMTANVTFDILSKPDVLQAPVNAVKTEGAKSIVLVPVGESTENPTEKEVQVGITDGKKIEIVSGLNEGDSILSPEYKSDGKKKDSSSSPFSPMNRPRGR